MPYFTNNTGNVSPSISAATIAGYRNAFNQGNIIRSSDIANLQSLYNSFATHSHVTNSFTDYYWVAYGNTSPYATTAGTTSFGGMNFVPGTFPTMTQGNLMLVSNVNTMASTVSSLPAQHYHPMGDVVW